MLRGRFDLRWIVSVFSLYYSMIVVRALLWTELRGGGYARHPMERLVMGYLHRATLDAASLLLAMLIVNLIMSARRITDIENDDTLLRRRA